MKGLKTANMEHGRLNEKRSNEVNSTSIAVAGEEEVESVRQDVAGQGKNIAQLPLSFLPCGPEPCSENRELEGGTDLEER